MILLSGTTVFLAEPLCFVSDKTNDTGPTLPTNIISTIQSFDVNDIVSVSIVVSPVVEKVATAVNEALIAEISDV